jgi:formylglycine-generating enzyme required for sulfatase activity
MQDLTKPGIVYLISSGGILNQVFSPLLTGEMLPYINLIDAEEFSRQIKDHIPDRNSAPQIIFLDISDEGLSRQTRQKIEQSPALQSVPIIDVQVSSQIADQRLIAKIHKISKHGFKFKTKITASFDRKEMFYIPAGVYKRRRGISPSFSKRTNAPRTESFAHAFYIDRYPVTNQEYSIFLQAIGHPAPALNWEEENLSSGKSNHPVTGMRWKDVLAYAKWSGKQIPTPDQWEKAAFGEKGQNFPWGDEFNSSLCNISESGVGGTTPVDLYSPGGDSPYGISDMFGNIWEWVYDWTSSAETRMLMGGAYDTPLKYLLPPHYARIHANPGLAGANFGFRLCSALKVQHLEDI